jgi:hypothetical protein
LVLVADERNQFRVGQDLRVLALPAAPATSDVLLAHLFASGFAQTLVYRLLRKRFPMTLPWGIDWSPIDPRGGGYRLFRGGTAR